MSTRKDVGGGDDTESVCTLALVYVERFVCRSGGSWHPHVHDSDVVVFFTAKRSVFSSGIEGIPVGCELALCVKATLSALPFATIPEVRGRVLLDSGVDMDNLPVDARREESGKVPARAFSRNCDSKDGAIEASEPAVEYDRLGGRDALCEDMDDVRMFVVGASGSEKSARLLVCDNGRRNDTVLDLRNACRSTFSFSSSSVNFLTSGSLNSSFPFLSEAKYSSPRPKTTWSDVQSRMVPSVGLSQSFSAGGRSYPSMCRQCKCQ